MPATTFVRPAADCRSLYAFSPSSLAVPQADAEALAWLATAGLTALAAPEPRPHLRYAGTDDERGLALLAGLQAPERPILWARRGGSGSARLLPALAEPLRAALHKGPPWLIGFSDVTALHAVWQAQACMSVHGANLCNLLAWSAAARAELLALLGRTPPTLSYAGVCLLPGATTGAPQGPLVGGNLTVLASLVGTGVLPPWHGCVVLLEDVHEAPYRLDRALYQLLAAGQLDGIVGVAIGQLTHCGPAGASYGSVEHPLTWLEPTLAALGVPVLAELPIGHADDSRPVLLGGRATLDVERGQLTVAP